MDQFANVAQYVPEALKAFQNIDFDKALRSTWYNNNASMSTLKSVDQVEEERAAEAAALQQQQQQEAMAGAAEAYSKTTGAAEEGSAAQAVGEQLGA